MRPRDFQHVHFRLKLGEPRELHVQVASVLVDAFEQNIQEDAKAPIGPALTLDHIAAGVALFYYQQFLVECVDEGGRNRGERRLAEAFTIFHDIAADEAKTDFMVASCPNTELGKPTIRPESPP